MWELHRRSCTTWSDSTQSCYITECFSQRNFSFYDTSTRTTCFHTFNLSTTFVQVADYITHAFFRSNNFHLHDRFHQSRTCLFRSALECLNCTNFERQLVRVNRVEWTIDQCYLQFIQRIAGKDTVLHCFFKTFLNRRDKFLRNVTTLHFIDELQSTFEAFICRFDTNDDISKLTTTTRLFLVNFTKFNRFSDSFLVSNLRFTLITFNLEFTTQTVNDDIQVKLTHTANYSLTCFFVSLYTERRVFSCQLSQSHTQLIQVFLSLRLYCNTDNRIGEIHWFQCDRIIFVTQRITSTDILETNTSTNITTTDSFHRILLVWVHLEQTRDTFFLTRACVVNIRTCR